MKKRSKSDRSLESMQKSADSQGIRLQKVNAGMSDGEIMEREVKKGLKDHQRMF